MACGTGKTLTSLWIRERLGAGRTLFLLPSLNLLSQTLREWTAESRTNLNWICVCSDQTVAKQSKDADDWVVNTSELGIPVSSDPEDIKAFLEQYPDGVVFSTYQSSALVRDAQKDLDVPSFDLAIADEAHRCAGKVSESFGCILDGQKIRANKRLFMTATPRLLSGRLKEKAGEERIQVACMDDLSVFGEILYKLSFSQAIERELLCDYRVVIIGVDDPMVQASIEDKVGITTTSSEVIDAQEFANHIALSKAIDDYALKRVITFHSRVKGASDFARDHKRIIENLPYDSKPSRKIKAGFVSGNMDSRKRNLAINELRNISGNEVGILSNARCLSEGVDVPTLDGVAFINPRSSVVDIIQAVGRAIRKSEDKSCGYIILPVYLGENECLEEEICSSRFSKIWKVLLALKSQDDSLSNTLDALRTDKGKGVQSPANHSVFGNKVLFDIPEGIPDQFMESLKTMVVVNTTDSWNERYGELVEFYEKKGHSKVRPSDGKSFHIWTTKQRGDWRDGTLSKERIQLLDEIEFIWDLQEGLWQKNFSKLVKQLEKYPSGSTKRAEVMSHRETHIGRWCGTQRTLFVKGELLKHRMEALDSLDFIWDFLDHRWQHRVDQLEEFVRTNGHARVPKSYGELGTWVHARIEDHKCGRLSLDKVKQLESLGFIWNQREHAWKRKFDELLVYVSEKGNADVPNTHPTLGSWVYVKRQEYKKGKMSQVRIDLLEGLPGWHWIGPRQR